jgi:hypothetical protein
MFLPFISNATFWRLDLWREREKKEKKRERQTDRLDLSIGPN